jgi:PhnB protein
MQTNPYLHFNGNCEAAFKYYAETLGTKIEAMMTHENTPAEAQTPPEWRKKILHAYMKVGGTALMASDAPPGHYHKPQGFAVSLQVSTPEEAERTYQVLSKDGAVQVPMQQTFFASRFAMFTDQFGIPWMINCPLNA